MIDLRRAILTSPTESSSQWSVLVALAAMADPRTGIAMVSIRAIAETTRLGRSTVMRMLNELQSAGVLERRQRMRGEGGYKPTAIRIVGWESCNET